MNFTNKMNLPQYIVDWLVNDDYDHSSDPFLLSATTLLKPIKAYWLSVRHHEELKIDVADLIASRFGSAIHDSIERIKTEDVQKETRINKQININGINYTVSGKFDILVHENNKWILRDIKTTSVWSYIYGGKDDDYQKQLSIYRWLLSDTHLVEDVAYIDFFFTDWQSSKAKIDPAYPQHRVGSGYKISLMSLAETEEFVKTRVTAFDKYRNLPDNQLPECTKDELWASEDTFAVYKKDAKRATKVCASQEEANCYMKDKKINGYIEFRPAKIKRCRYCSASPFCNQFASLAQHGLIDNF